MAHVHVSWLDPHKLRKFTVVGSKKMVVFDDMEASEKIKIYDKGVDHSGEIVSYGDALTVRNGDILIPKISLQEPLKLECTHFVDCIRERKKPLTDGIDGLRVVKVLDAAQKSLKAGGAPVAIQPLPQEVA
jgi:predicted dehydrogenase